MDVLLYVVWDLMTDTYLAKALWIIVITKGEGIGNQWKYASDRRRRDCSVLLSQFDRLLGYLCKGELSRETKKRWAREPGGPFHKIDGRHLFLMFACILRFQINFDFFGSIK